MYSEPHSRELKYALDFNKPAKIPCEQAPVVRRVDSAIRWINLYPVDSAVRFSITYPLDSDLTVG